MRKRLPILRDDPATGGLGRREVFQWVGAVAASQALSACSGSSGGSMAMMKPPPPPPPPASFLTAKQKDALAALADYVFPPDHQPGGAAMGVVSYVDNLLTALDGATPMIFAGGPYSGRQPYATPDGAVGTTFPADSFTTFLPLDRYREAAWKLRLFGSAGVPGGGINDTVLGKTIGLRDQVPQALDMAVAALSVPLDTMTPHAQVAQAWNSLPAQTQGVFLELVLEGCFSTPEYGGNTGLAGFSLCHFEGDSQPLGYSLYDEATRSYRQRPDAPVSGPNPGADPDPMDAATQSLIKTLVSFAGGKVFF